MNDTQSTTNPTGVRPGAEPIDHVPAVPIYAFKDLVGKSRERALEWLRTSTHESSWLLENWAEGAIEALEAYGFDLSTRNGPDFNYSLSNSQGDGVAFYGRLDLTAFVKALEAPPDVPYVEAFQSFDDLDALKRLVAAAPDVSAEVTRNDYGHHYSHAKTMRVSLIDEDPLAWVDERPTDEAERAHNTLEANVEEAVLAWVRNVAKALERSGYAEIDYQTTDEALTESMEANEYTFTAERKREG